MLQDSEQHPASAVNVRTVVNEQYAPWCGGRASRFVHGGKGFFNHGWTRSVALISGKEKLTKHSQNYRLFLLSRQNLG
jgi:hypothetical protein